MPQARALQAGNDADDARGSSAIARFFTGMLAFSAGVFICGACGSYTPTDPSFNSAVPAVIDSVTGLPAGPDNLFGHPGAMAADLFTQGFGWTAWLMGFALMIGGLRRTLGIGQRDSAAWTWGMAAVILAATCLAEWPIPKTWALSAGLGGVVGDVLLAIAATPFAALKIPDAQVWASLLAGVTSILFAAMAMGLGASDGASLWRALTRKPERAPQPIISGVPALASTPASEGGAMGVINTFARLLGHKPKEVIEPIVVTEEDEFEDSDRGFFTAVEKAEGVGGRTRPITPRVLESRPVPEAEAAPSPVAPSVRPSTKQSQSGSMPGQGQTRRTPAPAVRDASQVVPPIELLDIPPQRNSEVDEARLLDMADRLQIVFNDFGVKGRITEVRPGPVVTLFELEPAPGVKSSRVIALADDIARSMSATSARVAVIPGRNAIGIELPNPTRETVYLRDLLTANEFSRSRMALPLALGENIEGQPTIADLGKMPHLLIAGTTGSGKSVGINAMILSLMFKLPPEKCRFIMIDPKMLELSIYEGIPHLLAPVVTDPQKAVLALKWVVREMESRYEIMSKMGVRNLAGFNQKAEEAAAKGEHLTRQVQTGWNKETGEAIWENEHIKPEPMPHIVVIIDEMADLMLVAGKDIESAVQRIAQMARAAGIHLITATQRPSVDVITGTIKANFPTRVSYMVTTKIDSRTILGEQGAEQLLGMGDLLWMQSGGKITRVHGPFVKDEEVERVVTWLKEQGTPQYVEGVTDEVEEEASVSDAAFGTSSGDPEEDMYREAVAAVLRDKRPTTSYVQRVLRIGYNRAASMIERMEREGVITAADHSGKRQIATRDSREDAA
ncbi:MAG: DNA translocase FtsK 4TM domain-containing protein [Hyphomonadaceae bacterium]|nr:DNA translocase FtsK 4TM domain-containing protein [Hyphomonadaceae bacterium]